MTLPSLQIATQGLIGQLSPTLLNIATQGLIGVSVPIVPPSSGSGGGGYWHGGDLFTKFKKARRRKLLAEARAEKAEIARATQATKAVTPEPVAEITQAQELPAFIIPSYQEQFPVLPISPIPVYKPYAPSRSIAPVPQPRRRAAPVIPEKIRKQRLAMKTLVLALSIMED